MKGATIVPCSNYCIEDYIWRFALLKIGAIMLRFQHLWMMDIDEILTTNKPIQMKLTSLLGRKPNIKVNVKLLAGLDKIEGYVPEKGIELLVPEGIKLKKAVKSIELQQRELVCFMINGERVKSNAKLQDGDEIFCFLPFAGG
jgi:molybdopterin converting factor small subunit